MTWCGSHRLYPLGGTRLRHTLYSCLGCGLAGYGHYHWWHPSSTCHIYWLVKSMISSFTFITYCLWTACCRTGPSLTWTCCGALLNCLGRQYTWLSRYLYHKLKLSTWDARSTQLVSFVFWSITLHRYGGSDIHLILKAKDWDRKLKFAIGSVSTSEF